MELFKGKRGIVMGVANHMSLATSIAKWLVTQGAEVGISYLQDAEGSNKMKARALKATNDFPIQFCNPCDVSSDTSIDHFFSSVLEHWDSIDFLVHSIAFAPIADLKSPTIDVSRSGFIKSMDISCYSIIPLAKQAAQLMTNGGAICAMTYLGGEKVVPGYNLMGICKAALESTIQYLAYELGKENIRINGISAGAVKTLSSSAVKDFKSLLSMSTEINPLQRATNIEDIAKSTGYLLSDMASGVTGEIHHVDCGFNIMAAVNTKTSKSIPTAET